MLHTITRPREAAAPWDGRTGRIDAPLVREAAAGLERPLYYVCGPPAFSGAMLALLRGPLGVPAPRLRSEVFTGY